MNDASTNPSEPATDAVDEIRRAWERELPGVPTASIGVVTRIWRIGKLLDDDRRRTMTRLGMEPAIRDLLATLRRAGPPYRLTPGEIAERALVSPGAVSQRLARAERAGWVCRSRGGADGRTVQVELTDAGHDLIAAAVDELLGHEEELLRCLDAEQREQLADLLRILLKGLSDR